MHIAIVIAHPEAHSLTHAIAAVIADGITHTPENTVEMIDLAQEGFDPRITEADLAVHRRKAQPPADVKAEQERLDRADVMVLVYPIYWWGMPALLKGWVDRVLSNGWAFDTDLEGPDAKKLSRLRVHLVAVGGGVPRTFEKHGYAVAMETVIDHGIFHYCGSEVASSTRLLNSEAGGAADALDAAREIGRDISLTGAVAP